MGWKNIKEYFRIEHYVAVTEEGICIGSPYIHNLIVIGGDGRLKKRPKSTRNDDLNRYQRELEADPDKVKLLLDEPDKFERSIPIYTYSGGEIIEKHCEEPGWPNVTHDGCMMYENTFSTDKAKVVGWAKRNADLGVKWELERIEILEKDMARARIALEREQSNRIKLEADHPRIAATQ